MEPSTSSTRGGPDLGQSAPHRRLARPTCVLTGAEESLIGDVLWILREELEKARVDRVRGQRLMGLRSELAWQS